MNYFLCVLSSLLVLKSNASDPLVGLLAQGEQPCFETVESENCDTPIHEVFTPKYKGTDTTTPNTKFYLFTSKSKERAELLHNCGGKLPKNSSFNSTEKTVFVVHGVYEGVCRSAFQREYKEQLFIRGGYNVILVDWTWGNFPDPNGAIINSFVAGEETGFVIKNIMMQNNYADGSKFHIIGHSAGAYISITAGKFIREWSSAHKLRRITLLDTGVLVYRNDDFAHNTTYKEAHFVDVIHADAGTCFGSVVGALTPLGHADFFPNGGTLQLSCYFHAIEAILRGDILVGAFSFLPQLCFHLQAIEYFKVSINHPGGLQIGVECDSYEDFLSGKCTRCCKENRMNCAVAGMDAERYFPYLGEPRKVRKYYYNLGLVCPYNEDYEIINKDC